MPFNINDNTLTHRLNQNLEKAKAQEADSLSKLSTGSKFTPEDPQPGERAIAENMEYRLRSLSASKRNVNDAISLLHTAEGSLSEINNMITRMKEINVSAASTTLSDQERRYLFIEYEALHDEVNRIALTTEFNGIPLLNGESSKTPQELIFRVDDPFRGENTISEGQDVNTIRFKGLKSVTATTEALGLKSAKEFLEGTNDEEGIDLEAVEQMLLPEEDDVFSTTYDQAIARLSTHRAVYGALESRLQRTLDFIDVYQENISAAKSKIADTDYATEVSKMLQAKISVGATTALLAQSNINAKQTFQLLNSVV